MPMKIAHELNNAFTSYGTVDSFRDKITELFRLYQLSGNMDEYIELYKELKGPKG